MEKANPIKKYNSQEIPNIEDSIFNSKLFLNVNFKNDYLNNSFSEDSENSTEIEDLNSNTFLTKELIEELNSSISDISLKDEKSFNNNKSFLYYNITNKGYPFVPIINNNYDKNEDILKNNIKSERFNKYNISKNTFKNNYDYKKYRNIKDKKRDWVCQLCLNLNYSFRTECNRCKLPKERCIQNINYIIS